jgi:hypothetical protein
MKEIQRSLFCNTRTYRNKLNGSRAKLQLKCRDTAILE